jgi:hypothetical protein
MAFLLVRDKMVEVLLSVAYVEGWQMLPELRSRFRLRARDFGRDA